MMKETTLKPHRSVRLLSSALLGFALFGTSFAHAQDSRSARETGVAAQDAGSPRGIEKSDIRRGHTRVGDLDGDGLGDAAPVARQADLKKLADELVNSQEPPADTGGTDDQNVGTKVDAGNALNTRSMNGRAGDPIPGIDITVNQGAPRSSTGSDPATEPTPALDPNPSL